MYYEGDSLFFCSECRRKTGFSVYKEGLVYLSVTSTMTFEEAKSVSLEKNSLNNIKKCLILIVQDLVEYPLKSLKSGKNII